jgi:hypothetical protein
MYGKTEFALCPLDIVNQLSHAPLEAEHDFFQTRAVQ